MDFVEKIDRRQNAMLKAVRNGRQVSGVMHDQQFAAIHDKRPTSPAAATEPPATRSHKTIAREDEELLALFAQADTPGVSDARQAEHTGTSIWHNAPWKLEEDYCRSDYRLEGTRTRYGGDVSSTCLLPLKSPRPPIVSDIACHVLAYYVFIFSSVGLAGEKRVKR